jgi:tetratricopeptide (TPR) repeat protein
MTFKGLTILSLTTLASFAAFSQEASDSAEAPPPENPELKAEIAYVEALIANAYPDFAAPIIEATKKKWPESEAVFFALEVRGMLALGQFEAAEKLIASLPDRKSVKFWTARLEVANSHYARGQMQECMKIYDEFFVTFPKPPKEIFEFYMNACFTYGQLLVRDNRFEKAAEAYEKVLPSLKGEAWLNLAVETAEIYIRLAESLDDLSKRKKFLQSAEAIVNKLLWRTDKPVIFGRAVSMKAHIAQLGGDIERANKTIEEHIGDLESIHAQILEVDPDGKYGLLRMSPLPQCRYLQAKMLWQEAKKLFATKSSASDKKAVDEKIKDLMFGPRVKGKRQGSRAAFNIATTVFLKYETSVWAPEAGELSDEIREFAQKQYGANIKTKVSKEQLAKVRAAQFKSAWELFNSGDYLKSIDAYFEVLSKYPEKPESVAAVENIVNCYLDLVVEAKSEELKEEYRINADAVSGYLAERFSGNEDKVIVSEAGNAVLRIAAKEAERKQNDRAEALYVQFISNFRSHPVASSLAMKKAMEYKEKENYSEAIRFFGLITQYYTNTIHYAPSLQQLSYCHGKLGNKKEEIDYMISYLDVETVKIRRLQGQFNLAQMYRKDGEDILNSAETNATPEEIELQERRGTAQIIRAVKQFNLFSDQSKAALNDPATPESDRVSYRALHEGALFMIGECWSRMKRPEKYLKMYRERAAGCYENYVKEYPEGKYAKTGFVKLGMIYTALGEAAKSKDALDRLSRNFPDSDEAKNAKPRLAKSLIEIGMREEGTQIYAEMLRTDGSYSAYQFLNAGEALIQAKSWDLANQAFEKAIRLAGTNSITTVARSRLGQAKCAWKEGSYAQARESLDLFLADEKMSRLAIAADANFMLVEVASEQGRVEKDKKLRGQYFGDAIKALRKVRQYWGKKPRWEQDSLELLSGDVLVDRMKAEESMGLKEEALETCGRAASTFQVFLQSHPITEERPIDKWESGEVANLERAYSSMIPLFSLMGAQQADRVIKYGEEYMKLFPEGKSKTLIANCINKAKADLPSEKPVSQEGE